LPALCACPPSAASARASAAAESNRLPTSALIWAISLGHCDAAATLTTDSDRIPITATMTKRRMRHPLREDNDPASIARPGRSAEMYENGPVLLPRAKTRHAHGGIVDVGAGRHVPPPGMPRTRHDGALQIAIAKRSPPTASSLVHP